MPRIDKPDVIVVGSGAGGGTAARVLTGRGKSVVVFEKGPQRRADDFLPYDELHYQEHKALRPSVQTDPLIYMDPTKGHRATPSEKWWIGNMVGGSTMIWEANLPRYTAEDFSVLTVMRDSPPGTSTVNWPWSYEEFVPHFERAEWEWGVSGKMNQWPAPHQEPSRPGYDYPMPPIRQHASTVFLMQAFQKVGMHPYLSPRGINSRTYNGRPGCPFCGYCQGYGCAVNDRASSTNTVLARALTSGRCDLRPGHCVTRILWKKNGRVRGVEYKAEPNGKPQVMEADTVVVSIQAIESARLFLVSEIPNPNHMIGRYLTYHTKGSAELCFKNQPVWDEGPDRIFQPRTSLGSLQLRDLYVINDPSTYLTKGGKFSIYDPFTIYPVIRLLWGLRLWGKPLQDRMQELRSRGGVSFSFTGETMSTWDNRVELDARTDPWGVPLPRVYYEHHEYDMALSRYALQRVVDVMVAAGGELRRFEPQGRANAGYGHNHGTLRAGTDAGSSVLDTQCQSWDVKGLYVLDAAWMPTAGASNPGLTTIANAYRVAESIP